MSSCFEYSQDEIQKVENNLKEYANEFFKLFNEKLKSYMDFYNTIYSPLITFVVNNNSGNILMYLGINIDDGNIEEKEKVAIYTDEEVDKNMNLLNSRNGDFYSASIIKQIEKFNINEVENDFKDICNFTFINAFNSLVEEYDNFRKQEDKYWKELRNLKPPTMNETTFNMMVQEARYAKRQKESLINPFNGERKSSEDIESKKTKRQEFILYEKLSNEQKIHIADFEIINSIENSTDEKFRQEEKEVLLDVIKNAWLKDESNTSLSTIADTIVEAYSNKEVDLEALENANGRDIAICATGYESFENLKDLENEYEEEDEV